MSPRFHISAFEARHDGTVRVGAEEGATIEEGRDWHEGEDAWAEDAAGGAAAQEGVKDSFNILSFRIRKH